MLGLWVDDVGHQLEPLFRCVGQLGDFSDIVLPKYFEHRSLTSFIRQLNLYGFRKVNSAKSGDTPCQAGLMYAHPDFRQDCSEERLGVRFGCSTGTPLHCVSW